MAADITLEGSMLDGAVQGGRRELRNGDVRVPFELDAGHGARVQPPLAPP
jgi:hypothetical protein